MVTIEAKKTNKIDNILAWLKANKRSVKWLSGETGINYNTLYAMLILRSFILSDKYIKLINEACEEIF